jgi:(4S)-4-hydroxy-5-phosphonooxypentane-2,3-dione isomerase
MFVVLAELKVAEGKAEDAKAAFRKLAETVKGSEEGTLTYTFHQQKDDPHTFFVYECYRDEAAFSTHMSNLAQHAAAFAGLLVDAPKTTFLEAI